jgi:hypothetical protein
MDSVLFICLGIGGFNLRTNHNDFSILKNMSFNAFAQFKSQGKQTQALEDVIKDENLKQCLRHMSKKDPTTKQKALVAISEGIKKISHEEAVIFLSEWISYMKKLCLENNRKIRQYAFVVLSGLIFIVKKENFSPHLKGIMGVWLIGMHDSDIEVSKEANKLFDTQFPKNKHADVYKFCQEDVFKYLRANFLFTCESLNETKIASEEEAEENYDRFISASILALNDMILHLATIDVQKFDLFGLLCFGCARLYVKRHQSFWNLI